MMSGGRLDKMSRPLFCSKTPLEFCYLLQEEANVVFLSLCFEKQMYKKDSLLGKVHTRTIHNSEFAII